MFKTSEWKHIQEAANRKDYFDWNIPNGYCAFTGLSMTVHQQYNNAGRKAWRQQRIVNWRNLSRREVNKALREGEWMAG